MSSDQRPRLLALRVEGRDHALEPGRDHVLGSAADCDLRLDAKHVTSYHVRIRALADGTAQLTELSSPMGVFLRDVRVREAQLAAGDAIRFGDATVTLVEDDGNAQVIPVPALRAEATLRRILAARAAHPALRPESVTFHDLMAAELERAPWFLISLAAHGALLFLLYLLFPARPPSGDARATVTIDVAAAPTPAEREGVELPEVVAEQPPDTALPLRPDDPPPFEVEVIEPEPPDPRPRARLQTNVRITAPATQEAIGAGGGADLSGLGSASFRKTVATLQQSGLEIVFVFDSTGSMGMTIRQTKDTIVEMLDMLRALVPDARFGLVTYRDRGRTEEYVVHELPLGLDIWHAANFVQSVTAEGGGDRPEAVYDGLRAAFEQPWRRNSKRVVILAGDAPPHGQSWQRLEEELQAFAGRPNSHVHALVTSPRDAGRDTHEQFRRIAELGNGECMSLDRHDQVLQRVLDLAFGRQYDGDLAEVRRAVLAARNNTETWALDLSRRGGEELAAALLQRPVHPTLVNALVRMPRRRVAFELVDLLAASRTPAHSRHAIAWVLQRVLQLSAPPVDPMSGKAPGRRELRDLRVAADRLLH